LTESITARTKRWVETRLHAAWEQRQRRDLAAAIATLDSLLAARPDEPAAYLARGIARGEAGDLDGALTDLRCAADLAPGEIDAYAWVDHFLSKRQRWDEIAACWTHLLDRAPGNARAYLERGGAYMRKGDSARALADAREACRLGEARACEMVRRLGS
jgi:tetratricopeptide (TPR) repeat protein